MSQQTWYEKLKASVPSWVFEDENYNEAIFEAFAASLNAIEDDFRNHLAETFIDTASTKYLDQHGTERDIERLPAETDPSYAYRVKRIENNSNCVSIKSIVDGLLINGTSTIVENFTISNFLNRESFINRGILSVEVLYNAFTILVNKQIPEAVSFYNREMFMDREFLSGSNESSLALFNKIITEVDKAKAFGTVYRLIERPTE